MVTGIGDFSPHTVNGDPMMDIAGAVIFLELGEYPAAAEDAAWLESVAVERHGAETAHWIEVYRRFYGFYFSDTFAVRPADLWMVPATIESLSRPARRVAGRWWECPPTTCGPCSSVRSGC